jgi:crossover junction endodeoxyribonuclease RuvC
MRVLALDPGYDRLGIAVIEHGKSGKGNELLLHSSCIMTDKTAALPDRLTHLGHCVQELLKTHAPEAIAIETLFFNKNITTAMGVAQMRGIILFLAKNAGCQIFEFGPQEVKVAVTGYGKSDKKAVIDMVKRLIPNAPEAGHDDEYDAIAVGITALAHHRTLP